MYILYPMYQPKRHKIVYSSPNKPMKENTFDMIWHDETALEIRTRLVWAGVLEIGYL